MQERYLGDVHDYVKWALLIHLHNQLGDRIGVNWYKTVPEVVDRPGNEHGNNRRFRDDPNWQNWKPDLFKKLGQFQDPAYRSFANFIRDEVLPAGTQFAPDEPLTNEERTTWHQRAVSRLSDAGIVFLDPDNGFQVQSWTRRRKPKYAMFAEAHDYFEKGKIVIGIQFVSKRDPKLWGREVRRLLLAGTQSESLPIVRARVAPNILFIALCPKGNAKSLREAMLSFAAGSQPFNDGEKRIELFD